MKKASQNLNILFIADIIGNPGLKIVKNNLPDLKGKYNVDLCIANGENGASGKGLSSEVALEYFKCGIDVITSGNHIFENFKFYKFLSNNTRILRPINYPAGVIGRGSLIFTLPDDIKVGIINAQGRTFMYPIDCPFRSVIEETKKIKEVTPNIFLDFHAEASAEKMAMGWYLDGKVSAVIGTHTHVQTADERILPSGTAYITDVGMTGPINSVIGMKKDIAINRFLYQVPSRYQPAIDDLRLSAVILTINKFSGKALSIKRLFLATNDEGKILNYGNKDN